MNNNNNKKNSMLTHTSTLCHKWALVWLHATGLEVGYLVVGVALWIERGERRGWDFIQPLSLWVRPRLLIKGNLRRFYLRCTDKAQHGATHTTHAMTHSQVSHDCSRQSLTEWTETVQQPRINVHSPCLYKWSTAKFRHDLEVSDNQWPFIQLLLTPLYKGRRGSSCF